MQSSITPSIFSKNPQGLRIGRTYSALTTTPKAGNDQSVIAKIITENKNQNRKQIDEYRASIVAALNPDNPRHYLLQDLYDDYERDGHLQSQFNIRFGSTLGHVYESTDDGTGEVDKETTKLFQSGWFFNFLQMALSYWKKGYAVLELVDPATMRFEMVPRRNVIPQKKKIVFQVNGDEGVYYDTGFENRIIEVGNSDYLGILFDIIPQLIWKRNAQQSWAEFSEKFGMPMITATTSKTNSTELDKLEQILEALGESARAILPNGTTINVTPFAGKDSFQVYDAQINRCNSEISKPIVGGTMATDNGSSRSQGEVHERNLDDKITTGDRSMLTYLVNDKLIPMMRVWGWPVPENRTFVFPETSDISLLDHWSIVKDALGSFDIPIDWISKTFNIPIDGLKKVTDTPEPGNDPEAEQEPADAPEPKAPKKGKKPTKPAASFFD